MVEWLDIDKFYAHANARFHDPHHSQRFDLLIFSCERDPDAGVRRQRLAGTNKDPTHGQVGSHAIGPRSGFEVQDLDIRCKGIADTKAAVPDGQAPGIVIRCAIIHVNYIAHSRFRRLADCCFCPWWIPARFSVPQKDWLANSTNGPHRRKKQHWRVPGMHRICPRHVIIRNDKQPLLRTSSLCLRASLNIELSLSEP